MISVRTGVGLSLNTPTKQSAFTMIELVMVIVVLGILAIGSVSFISKTAQGMVDTSVRQNLATTANIAVEKMLREVRRALPNSVRNFADSGNQCLEFVPIVNSSEYISVPTLDTELSNADSFDAIQFVGAVGGESGFVAVYPNHINQVYGHASVAVRSISSTTATASAVGTPAAFMQTITFDGAATYQFPSDSPLRRFFLVSTPVSFCNDVNGRLWRYENYGFQSIAGTGMPTTGSDRRLIADSLRANSLAFNITPAQLQRNAVVRVSLIVEQPGTNEQADLTQEVQLRNVP